MKVRIFPTEEEAARECAEALAAAVAARPTLVLGLPTGRSPLRVYQALAARVPRVDFAHVTTFNLDEFVGVGPGEPGSFRAYMERHLFGHVNLAPERIHFLDGRAPDPEAECGRYEAALEAAGGLDWVLLGVGQNGHLAFNEPAEGLRARTHRVALARDTRAACAAFFGAQAERVPTEALTLGMGALLKARRALLLAFGERKAAAVAAALEGPLTPRCPASFLQLHRDAEVWLDPAAASGLPPQKISRLM